MPYMSLEKRYERYRSRVENSKRQRRNDGYDDLWERLVDMYSGRQFEVVREADQIAVNVAFATVNVIQPSISVNHPKITIQARDPMDDDRAVIAEAIMDYWWKSPRYGIAPEFRLAVKDFLIVGHGWVKTGYRYRETAVPLSESEWTDEFAKARSEADEFAAANPDLAAEVPTDEQISANIPNTKLVTTEDRPFAERVSFYDVYVDVEATSPRDMRWIAQRIVRPLEDAKDDERYSSAVRSKLQGVSNLTTKWTGDEKSMKAQGDDIKRVVIWEYYDLHENTMCVFSENVKGFLVKPTKMPYEFGHPFIMIRNYDVPNQFYPLGDLEAIEPLQNELNKTRSQLMNMRKQFARKYLIDPAAFDGSARAALESQYDNEFVFPNDTDKPLSELIWQVPANTPAPELYAYSDTIRQDVDLVSGVSDYQRGAAPDIRRTATEASLIQDAVNARSADKLAIVEASIASIGANLLCLARQFMTGEDVARVVGVNGQAIWVPYTQDELNFDADFEVEGGSTMPKNETFRQNQAMQLLTAFQPLLGTFVDPAPVVRLVLQAFDVKNPDEFMLDPMQQMMQQMMMGGGDPAAGGGDTGGAAPPEAAVPGEETMLPGGLDPQILAQLAGQVGLNVPSGAPVAGPPVPF